MSDLDWDDDDFEVQLPVKGKQENAFEDEEEEEEEEKPVAKKPAAKKKPAEKKNVVEVEDETLDDPVAEKLRRQKLVEAADFETAKELFGEGGATIDLDTYNPKTQKEFEKYGTAIAHKYLRSVCESAHFKSCIQSLLQAACKDLDATTTKEIETSVVALRNEKVKAEKKAAEEEKKKKQAATGKKKFLNAGAKGGDSGLEDHKYAHTSLDDDYDFM